MSLSCGIHKWMNGPVRSAKEETKVSSSCLVLIYEVAVPLPRAASNRCGSTTLGASDSLGARTTSPGKHFAARMVDDRQGWRSAQRQRLSDCSRMFGTCSPRSSTRSGDRCPTRPRFFLARLCRCCAIVRTAGPASDYPPHALPLPEYRCPRRGNRRGRAGRDEAAHEYRAVLVPDG